MEIRELITSSFFLNEVNPKVMIFMKLPNTVALPLKYHHVKRKGLPVGNLSIVTGYFHTTYVTIVRGIKFRAAITT